MKGINFRNTFRNTVFLLIRTAPFHVPIKVSVTSQNKKSDHHTVNAIYCDQVSPNSDWYKLIF